MNLSKSAVFLEQVINDVPLTSMKRNEAIAHIQNMETQRNELEQKVGELQKNVDEFRKELEKIKKKEDK